MALTITVGPPKPGTKPSRYWQEQAQCLMMLWLAGKTCTVCGAGEPKVLEDLIARAMQAAAVGTFNPKARR